MKKTTKKLNELIASAIPYEVDPSVGLNKTQVDERKKSGLVNKVSKQVTKTYPQILFDNLFNFLNIILFTVFILMLLARLSFSHYFFIIILGANIFIGIAQDINARRTVDKLRIVTDPKAKIIRGGVEIETSASEVVLSDIIKLSSGDKISADSVVREGEIAVDESLLTGESIPVKKKKGDPIYAGTFLTKSSCLAEVVKVGSANYDETLRTNASKFDRPNSEIKRSINSIVLTCGILSICFGATQFITFTIQKNSEGFSFNQIYGSMNPDLSRLIASVSGSIVAMLPTGMFLLTSLTLAVGVITLGKKRVLVQQLYCIEMLARVDMLCLDKTGTLTDGTMKLIEVIPVGKNTQTSEIGYLVSSILHFTRDSNPTAQALIEEFGSSCHEQMLECIPFDSELKYSAVSLIDEGSYVFGAYGFVPAKEDPEIKALIASKASEGNRCLVVARNKKAIKNGKVPDGCEIIGVLVLSDHIKDDAEANIKWFIDSGVEIRVISGDDPVTVSEIAKKVGVPNANKCISLEGKSLDETAALAPIYSVFGRVSPEQKAVLINTYKQMGNKVAMTGDGVNDILALKVADCSIAMASGSEAARTVSHLVALDSDFSKLPDVVFQGRRVINNLQRTCSVFVTKTMFAIVLSFIFIISMFVNGMGYPFNTANMFIWEFITIGIASFFLALQPSNEKLQGSFLKNILVRAFPAGLTEIIAATIPFAVYLICPNAFTSSTNPDFYWMATCTCAVVSFTLISFVSLFIICVPLNRYRTILFVALSILGILIFGCDIGLYFTRGKTFSPILALSWGNLSWGFYLTTALNVIIFGSLYFLLGKRVVKWIESIGEE